MTRRSILAVSAVLAAAALGSLGCPSASDYGPTCAFRGQDTDCGKCLASACRSQIDACCADSTPFAGCGQTVMPHVDACAGDGSCAALSSASGGSSGVAACLKASCAAACGSIDAGIRGSVKCDAKTTDGLCSCEATNEEVSSTYSCEPSTVASLGTGICCAEERWPAPGSKCTCVPVRCAYLKSNPNSCICGVFLLDEDFEETSSCREERPCCISADRSVCACNGVPCEAGEEERTSCSASDLTTECREREVPSCR